jgi:hypothetical protein
MINLIHNKKINSFNRFISAWSHQLNGFNIFLIKKLNMLLKFNKLYILIWDQQLSNGFSIVID